MKPNLSNRPRLKCSYCNEEYENDGPEDDRTTPCSSIQCGGENADFLELTREQKKIREVRPDASNNIKWRVGNKLGRTLYIGDQFIGTVDTKELADKIVEAVNFFDNLMHSTNPEDLK